MYNKTSMKMLIIGKELSPSLLGSFVLKTSAVECLSIPSINIPSTSPSTQDRHLSHHFVGIKLTIHWNLDRHLIDTQLPVGHWLAECWLTHMYRSTLDGVSAKISGLSTNCGLRCQSTVDWVLIKMLSVGQLRVNWGYQTTLNHGCL